MASSSSNGDNDFDNLNQDTLYNILSFLSLNSYVTFGLIDRRCHQIFDMFKLQKKTFVGILPISNVDALIKNTSARSNEDFGLLTRGVARGITEHKNEELFRWALNLNRRTNNQADEHGQYFMLLKEIVYDAIWIGGESNENIVKQIFKHTTDTASINNGRYDGANEELKYDVGICNYAAYCGRFSLLKWLVEENNSDWSVSQCLSKVGNSKKIRCELKRQEMIEYLVDCQIEETFEEEMNIPQEVISMMNNIGNQGDY